jgi:DUF3043 family protein
MPLLRKKTPPPPPEPEKPVLVKPGGKGRATPTRKEAVAARRNRPASTGGSGKEAKQAAKDERRRQSQTYREAMLSGDISRLPPREKAPERVLARDIVDGRRNFGPVFLFLLLANFASSLAQSLTVRVLFTYLLMLGLIVFVIDAVFLTRKVAATVQERYPGSRVSVKVYSIQRALLPGRFRMPRPRREPAGWLPAGIRQLTRRR